MTPVIGLICWLAALGIYAAMPLPKLPTGAVRPEPPMPIWVTDLFGFVIAAACLSLMLIGLYSAAGAGQAGYLLLFIPASLSIPFFVLSIRQRTSWARFFGNGFEFAETGLRTRVRYEDVRQARLRDRRSKTGLAAYITALGSSSRNKVTLLTAEEESRTLVLVRYDGTEFTISTELIPDMKKVLIGMDRAGVELPEGLSERERQNIRKRRERMDSRTQKPGLLHLPEQKQIARIAALVNHARRKI
ncbi:hypothetical protein [Roseibium aquae]|nr:hypothetical protein [Roseibium aquae]